MKFDWSRCFLQIIRREIVVFTKMLRSKVIDIFIITSTNILVFGYIMPFFGMQSNYGPFMVIGIIPMITFFEVIPRTSEFVADITEAKKISYMLTLPIPSGFVFAAIGMGWAACSSIITIFILPIAKIFFFTQLKIVDISIWRFILIFLSGNLFFGYFALWLVGVIKDMKYMSWVWVRVVTPMFMLGCYFYSWHVLYKASPWAAYLNLLNPVIYAVEGTRAAILGQSGNMSFVFCFLVLLFFMSIFAWHGIYLLKRRLDCV